jgi:hypothetical protein
MSNTKLTGLVIVSIAVAALVVGCSPPRDDATDVAATSKVTTKEPTAETTERTPATDERVPRKPESEKPKQPDKPSLQPPAETKRPEKPDAPPAPKPKEATPSAPTPKPEQPAELPGPAPLVVTGQILKASNVPEPGTAPYTECLTYLKYKVLSVESGEYKPTELLAVYWGMRKNKLMPAARFSVGQTHKMTLEPFSKHPELQRVMAADETEEYGLEPYWVVK